MAHARADQPLVPSFGVKVNGQPLVADVGLWIVRVVVEDDLDLPSMFTLEMVSREDVDASTPWTDDPRFELGVAVEVSFGYGDDREALITGEITALEPTFDVGGPPALLVRGYDRRHRLNTTRRTRSFVDQKDSDIASQLAAEAGLPADTIDSTVTHPYVLQADQTDLEFLRERAGRIHFELLMDGETLHFRPVASDAPSVVTLTLDDDLLDFRPRLSLVPVSEIAVRSWDPRAKQAIVASAASGSEVSTMGGRRSAARQAEDVVGAAVEPVVRTAVVSQAEADQIAVGRFNAASLDFIRGTGRARGRTDVRAGRVVRLDGLGTRFSGEYYVTSAVHHWSQRDGYVTDFRVRRNAT